MKKNIFLAIIILFVFLLLPTANIHAQADLPVVNAVLFYSPTCPHCHEVINNTLLPLIEKYGDQLQVIGVDVTQPDGQKLFLAALDKFKLQEGGVPFLVIADTYLVGSVDIPAQFPVLVESYLKEGGVDFPDIPGLSDMLPPTATPAPTSAASAPAPQAPAPTVAPPVFTSSADLTWQQRFAQDRAGNSLAVIFLLVMFVAAAWTAAQFANLKSAKEISLKENWAWIIPILSVVGLGVAGYLAYVETAQVKAVCGPVGDCNTVQQSEYARLFGILPIGVMGLMGYVAILVSWFAARFAREKISAWATLLLFGMTAFGTLFSIYLTFLEPFVIGATCAWCLTSAALMTALMLMMTPPAKAVLRKIGEKSA